MESSIIDYQIKVFDANYIVLIALIIALVIVGCSIFAIVYYLRDKNNVTSLRKLEKRLDFYSIDLIKINNRLTNLEDRDDNIDELHKSILELKSLIMRSKNGK